MPTYSGAPGFCVGAPLPEGTHGFNRSLARGQKAAKLAQALPPGFRNPHNNAPNLDFTHTASSHSSERLLQRV